METTYFFRRLRLEPGFLHHLRLRLHHLRRRLPRYHWHEDGRPVDRQCSCERLPAIS